MNIFPNQTPPVDPIKSETLVLAPQELAPQELAPKNTPPETAAPVMFIIDTMAILYRSHFAMLKNPLINSSGMNTSGIFGLTKMLLRIIQHQNPSFLAITSDAPPPTFRHLRYPDYKATREKIPTELAEQLPYIPRLVEALGLPFFILKGWEADDLIGTLAKRAQSQSITSVIVSGDKDLLQLLSSHTLLFNPKDSQTEGEEAAFQRFGCPPCQVTQVLGLMGDTSDNIPGVPGIGVKTAAKLINQFQSLENLYQNLNELPTSKLKERLIAHQEQAFLSRELATIKTDAPLEIDWEALRFKPQRLKENPQWLELLQELNFNSLHNLWSQAEGLGKNQIPATESTDKEKIHPYIFKSLAAFQAQAERWKQAPLLAFSTKTTSPDWQTSSLSGISFCVDDQHSYYLPFDQARIKAQQQPIWMVLKNLLEDEKLPKAAHDLKHEMQTLLGIELKGACSDTMIASHLNSPTERDHDLGHLALRELNRVPSSNNPELPLDVPITQAASMAAENVQDIFQLVKCFAPRLKKSGQLPLFEKLEVPLTKVLMKMERVGIRFDSEGCQKLHAEITQKLEQLKQRIYELANQKEFNLNSVSSLQQVLYENLRLHEKLGVRPRRIKLGMGLSTDEETLESMRSHPLPEALLKWREFNKLRSTYLEQLSSFVNPKTNHIHTHFRQTVAATGRLASDKPNLQNIPIRSEEGRKLRTLFLPSSPQHVLFSADYSQIELRVLAHYSQDPTFIKAFQQEEDIHMLTAMTLFDIPKEQITRTKRSIAKEVNFGLIYRMGPDKLAQVTQTNREQAKQFIQRFFQRYQTIRQLQDDLIAKARKEGYAQTQLGRKRPLPELQQSQTLASRNAEGAAINTPIQGTAAEIIKCAMLKVSQRLQKENLQTNMLLSIHDELLFDAPKQELNHLKILVKEEMENAMQLKIPLKIESGHGPNWLAAHP